MDADSKICYGCYTNEWHCCGKQFGCQCSCREHRSGLKTRRDWDKSEGKGFPYRRPKLISTRRK